MQIAYLGLFSKILDWILDKIFSPIFKFIANLLSTVFGWIFDKVLGPLLTSVLMPILEWLIDMIFELFAEVFYRIYVAILTLVDVMSSAFDVLIGMTPVLDTTTNQEEPLLDLLIQNQGISTAFIQIALLGLGIAMLLTIFATAKSEFDLDFENKRPVGMVLRSFMKTCINFLMVPLLCLFMLKLSGVILTGLDAALNQGNCTVGNTIFLTTSLDAAKNEDYNTSTAADPTSVGFEDSLRSPYYYGEKRYDQIEVVRADFNFSKFDYVVGYSMGIFMLIIIAFCLITFVQRIFEVIMLYLVSPLFVSTMPLDDGEYFKKWREMFIAKIFMGFGSAIGMRIYLMIIPIIMGNSIAFYNPDLGESMSTEMTYVMKLLFVVGGAFAVWKSNSMLTTLLNFQAGQSEAAGSALVGGAAAWVGNKIYGGTARAMSGMFPTRQERAERRAERKEEANQRFQDISASQAGSSGIPGLSGRSLDLVKQEDSRRQELEKAAASVKSAMPDYAKKTGGRIGGIPEGEVGGTGGGASAAFEGTGSGPGTGEQIPGGSQQTSEGGDQTFESGTEHQTLTSGTGESGEIREDNASRPETKKSSPALSPKVGKTAFTLGRFRLQYNREGRLRPAWNGRLLNYSLNEDGTSRFKLFGSTMKFNEQGKLASRKGWFTKQKFAYDDNNKRTLTDFRVNVPLLAGLNFKTKHNPNGRGVQLRSLPILGIRTKQQADGRVAVTNALGMKFAYRVDADGKRSLAGAKIGNMIIGSEGSDSVPKAPAGNEPAPQNTAADRPRPMEVSEPSAPQVPDGSGGRPDANPEPAPQAFDEPEPAPSPDSQQAVSQSTQEQAPTDTQPTDIHPTDSPGTRPVPNFVRHENRESADTEHH